MRQRNGGKMVTPWAHLALTTFPTLYIILRKSDQIFSRGVIKRNYEIRVSEQK